MAIPRKHPGVQVRVGKGTRTADTRDARDDATIIAWLQRIDMDVLHAATKPIGPTQATPNQTQPGPQSSIRGLERLEDQIRTVGVALTAFARSADLAKHATLLLGTALHPSTFRGALQGVRDGLRRLVGLALPVDVPIATAAATEAHKIARDASKFNQTKQRQARRSAQKAIRLGQTLRAAQIRSNYHPSPRNTRRLKDAKEAAARAARAATRTRNQAKLAAANSAATRQAAIMAAGTAARTATSAGTGLLSGGAAALAASGPIGVTAAVVASLTMVAGVSLAAGFAIKALGERMLEANKALAEFSPSLAMVIATANVRDTFRNIKTGEQIAPSAANLADNLASFKDSLQPLVSAGYQLFNNGLAVLLKVSNFILSPGFQLLGAVIQKIADTLGIIAKNTDRTDDFQSLGDWAMDIAMETGRRRGFAILKGQPVGGDF